MRGGHILVNFSLILMLAACGSKKHTKENTSPEEKPSSSATGGALSRFSLKALFDFKISAAAGLSLTDAARSKAACENEQRKRDFDRYLSEFQIPEKFCNGQDVKTGTRYKVTNGDDVHYVFAEEVSSTKLRYSYCIKDRSPYYFYEIETAGDGKGKFTLYGGEYRHTVDKYSTDPQWLVAHVQMSHKDAPDKFNATETNIRVSQGGDEVQTWSTYDTGPIINVPGQSATNIDRSIAKWDGQAGMEFRRTEAPHQPAEYQLIERTSYFSRDLKVLSNSGDPRFVAGGGLYVGADDLPPKLDQGLQIEKPEGIWDCQTADEDVNLTGADGCSAAVAPTDQNEALDCSTIVE